jgi:hypothetical protein
MGSRCRIPGPGRYEIRAIVEDLASGDIGAGSTFIEVARLDRGLADLSALRLGRNSGRDFMLDLTRRPVPVEIARDHDRRAPVEWQVFYAVARSWNCQVESLPRDKGGNLLLELLGSAKTAGERCRVLTELTARWVPDAEGPVAALLKAPDAEVAVEEFREYRTRYAAHVVNEI